MPTVIFPGGSGGGGGGGNLTIQEEGANVQTEVTTINFVGADVQAQAGGAGTAIIYIPTPTFASHFNTQDGTTDGRVSYITNAVGYSFSSSTKFIASPTAEGNPYNTGGWAATNQRASDDGEIRFDTAQQVTAMNGSTFTVTVLNPDGSTLQAYTTPAISGNAVLTSGEATPHISVIITNYVLDSATKYRANVEIRVRHDLIFTANALDGGRLNITVVQTVTDGTGPYTFNMGTESEPGEFFYDTNPTNASGSGATVTENVAGLVVKHLSGIEYYTLGSTFTFQIADIDNYNQNTVLTTNSLTIEDNAEYGFLSIQQSPLPGGAGNANFTGWTSQYDVQNVSYSNGSVTINDGLFRYFGDAANISGQLNHPWGGTTNVNTPNASILVDTYGTDSEDLVDYFNDEARRLESDYTAAWVSANTLGTASTASCQINLTGNLVAGDNIQLTDFSGANITFTADTNFAVGATAADTAANLSAAIAGSGSFGTAFVSPYAGFETYITVTQSSAGPVGNRTNNAPTGNVTVTDFTDGSNAALVMRSYIQDASRATFSNGTTLNPDWSTYKPDSGGLNPDYTALSGPASYFRTIVDATGLSRSSFDVTFIGTYNNVNVTNFTQYLANSALKFFVRKVNTSNAQGISGKTIPPMRLHGGTFGASFDQGKTIDGSYCRITTAATTTIQGTFATFGCVDGFYLEIQITDPNLKIDSINVVFT